MHRNILILFRCCTLAALLALGGQWATAAELGEAAVRSYIGQPLVVDIELVALAPDELQNLQIRMANPDVYRGANIGLHPALAGAHLSIMRREQGQFLHLTTTKPIEAAYVHVFFELIAGERRSVRGTTLWLVADPHPEPPPAPEAPAHVDAAHGSEPDPVALTAARARAAMHNGGASAAACQRNAAIQAKACAALDYKNATLTAQIIELEQKVDLLQNAVEAKPAPAKLLPPPVLKQVKKEPVTPTWVWVAAGAAAGLVVLGLVAMIFMRRKKKAKAAAPADEEAKPGLMARFKNMFKRKPKPDQEEPHV